MAIKNIQLPTWYSDPTYTKTQDFLTPYGMDIMKGNIPDYYKNIGMAGSPEFLDMLNMINRDIVTAGTEDAARRNVSGGASSLAITKAIADSSKTLRYQDYLNSIQGKEFLFTGGKSITEGSRDAGLSYGNALNQFNLQSTDLGLKKEGMIEAQKAQENAMWSQILKSVLGTAGTIAGAAIGGPSGAVVGSKLGSAAGGGGLTKFDGDEYDLSSILADLN